MIGTKMTLTRAQAVEKATEFANHARHGRGNPGYAVGRMHELMKDYDLTYQEVGVNPDEIPVWCCNHRQFA